MKNPILKMIVVNNGWDDSNKSDDWKIISILKYVRRNIKYVSDRVQYRKSEYWASVTETLANKKGDCEDGAILIYCLARTAGIPIEKIKLVAGSVKGGGHAWIRYVSDDYIYSSFHIDWCYQYNASSIKTRKAYFYNDKTITGDDRYYKMWFMVDEEKGT